jgi:hypothetical protein
MDPACLWAFFKFLNGTRTTVDFSTLDKYQQPSYSDTNANIYLVPVQWSNKVKNMSVSQATTPRYFLAEEEKQFVDGFVVVDDS